MAATGLAVASLSGCAADASDDGPPALLSLHATVEASAMPLSNLLEPALTFTPFVTHWGHTEFIVTGEHHGDLLGQFSLNIYDPPPSAALTTLTRGEPALAIGAITIVSPEHPSRLDFSRDDAGDMRVCTDQGECGMTSADPCGSLNNTPSCLGTVVQGRNWGNHGIAGRYLVMYLQEPAAAGGIYSQFFAGGRELSRGYNLVRYDNVTLGTADQRMYSDCQQRATENALNKFNAEHGTSYTNNVAIANGGREGDIRLLADWDGMMIQSTVEEGCVLPGAQKLMDDHGETDPLSLVFVPFGA
jgi:hypothetical protein